MHIMLDLETLGTRPGSVIASIGAAYFDPHGEGVNETFYTRILPRTCTDVGLTMDADTVMWWMAQSEEARKSTFTGNTVDIHTALARFSDFLSLLGTPRNVKVWGNGSDFDNVLLGAAYTKVGFMVPWSFSKNRCFRTIKNIALSKDIIIPERKGTHHNALDDAIHQALCLQAYIKNLGIILT